MIKIGKNELYVAILMTLEGEYYFYSAEAFEENNVAILMTLEGEYYDDTNHIVYLLNQSQSS